jgi:hypothetical protein
VAGNRGTLRFLLLLVAVLIGLQVVFLGLLFAAQAVPDRPIVTHLVEGIDDRIYGPTGRPDFMGGVSEAFTECVALGTGLGRPDLGVWQRTVRMPRLESCSRGDDQLRALARGEPVTSRLEYFRYWAGYTVVMRPVLALWGLGSLHMISGALLVAAIAGAVVVVARRTATAFALALVAPLILSSHLVSMPSTSLPGALASAAAFGGVALTAVGASRGGRGAVLGAVVGAALFNYVDLLSTPAIPWMLSATVGGAVVLWRRGRVGDAGRTVLAVGLAWPVAYLATWASRWALAVAALGWNDAWDAIGGKISERTQGNVASSSPGFLAPITRNVRYWLGLGTGPPVLVLAAAITLVAMGIAVRRHGAARLAWFAVLAAPAVLAPAWYAALRNHSLIHVAKVYASLPAAVGIVTAAALAAALAPDRAREAADVVETGGRAPAPAPASTSTSAVVGDGAESPPVPQGR